MKGTLKFDENLLACTSVSTCLISVRRGPLPPKRLINTIY